jgi:predicted nucleic acid-binding protein
LLLDTTVLIDVLRGRAAAQRLRSVRATGQRLHVCAINVEEVVRGLRPDEGAAAGRLLAGLRTVPLRTAEGRQAGQWRREFASRGVTLSQADCLVAAAALTAGGRIATGNPRHFPMPELTVEHWPVGA